jgi:hypothetical protein
MNVAITRARCCLWVVGHVDTLSRSAPWQALVRHAAAVGALVAAPGHSGALAALAGCARAAAWPRPSVWACAVCRLESQSRRSASVAGFSLERMLDLPPDRQPGLAHSSEQLELRLRPRGGEGAGAI